jgi:hypothetical protein
MKPSISVLVLLLAAVGTCGASPVTLKCFTESGTPAADITVDIDTKAMIWGSSHFEIRGVTERYITAIQPPSDTWEKVGGEVWVFDRETGDYLRAWVGFTQRGVNGVMTPSTLTTGTYHGRCIRPIL